MEWASSPSRAARHRSIRAVGHTADSDGWGVAPAFTFHDPDFNFKSLRVNAVFRWEFKPESTLYGVWTRQQQDLSYPCTFALGRDASALLSAATTSCS